MFKLFKDFGSSLMSSGESNSQSQPESNKQNAMAKNKHVSKKNFVVRRKDVVEELAKLTTKYPYTRPTFMGLRSNDELQICLSHAERHITLPKRSALPRFAGYAECTNAGKSLFNEDQAAAIEFSLGLTCDTTNDQFMTSLDKLEIFGVFDGHAGPDVAVTVSHELPHRVKERICAVTTDMKMALRNNVVEDLTPQTINTPIIPGPIKRKPTADRLVIGALEAAFHDMDSNLVEDESQYRVKGGCAALVALFYANKLYVANAGDCRAVMSVAGKAVSMSTDFTPEFERRRLQNIAEHSPDLLGDEFCSTQFTQRVTFKDVGSQMLYRNSKMEGWAYRTIAPTDLRFPMILGDGRRSRLLCTIGLTRGLGDHNLQVFDSCIKIKPFLSCIPEVKVYDFTSCGSSLTPDDVLIMGSDGLWDVITNAEAVDLVTKVLAALPTSDNTRYISAAQSLVAYARGALKQNKKDVWVLKNNTDYASHDDVTCFVVPLVAPSAGASNTAASHSAEMTAESDKVVSEEPECASALGVDGSSVEKGETEIKCEITDSNMDSHSEVTQDKKDQCESCDVTNAVVQQEQVTHADDGSQNAVAMQTGAVAMETGAVAMETSAVAMEKDAVAIETGAVATETGVVSVKADAATINITDNISEFKVGEKDAENEESHLTHF